MKGTSENNMIFKIKKNCKFWITINFLNNEQANGIK